MLKKLYNWQNPLQTSNKYKNWCKYSWEYNSCNKYLVKLDRIISKNETAASCCSGNMSSIAQNWYEILGFAATFLQATCMGFFVWGLICHITWECAIRNDVRLGVTAATCCKWMLLHNKRCYTLHSVIYRLH